MAENRPPLKFNFNKGLFSSLLLSEASFTYLKGPRLIFPLPDRNQLTPAKNPLGLTEAQNGLSCVGGVPSFFQGLKNPLQVGQGGPLRVGGGHHEDMLISKLGNKTSGTA